MPKPQVTATQHPLPFDRLSPADFERLCLWLVRREGYEGAEHFGDRGRDQGRDIVAFRDGHRVVFQCKRVVRLTPTDAKREVVKLRKLSKKFRPEEVVFIVSSSVEAETRDRAKEAWLDADRCRFWSGTELDEMVKRHPEILKEFFDLGRLRPAAGPPSPTDALLKIWLDRVARAHRKLMPYFMRRGAPLLEQVYIELQLSPQHRPSGEAQPEDLAQKHLLGRLLSIRHVLDLDPEKHPWVTRRWLLKGDPGSGKTTLLRHLARTLADAGGEPWVPVFASLPRLLADKLSIFGRIEEDLDRADQPGAAIRELLEEEAKEGRLLLLFDGLDEVPREARDRAEALLSELAARWPNSPIVATTRPIGAWSPGSEFLELEVLPIDAERRRAFLGRWFSQEGKPDVERAAEVANVLEAERSLRELASNPLYLTLLALLIQDGEKPAQNRTKLYDQIFDLLEEGRHHKPSTPIDGRLAAHTALCRLAYRMTEENLDGDEAAALEQRLHQEKELRALLREIWPRLRSYLNDVAEKTGILGPHDGEGFPWRYWHRTFREALTAEALVESTEAVSGEADWKPFLAEAQRISAEDAGRWAEPYALAVGRVSEPDRLVLALVEANRPLGLRAVATAQWLREETLQQVLELTDRWEERQEVFERLPELIDDPLRVLALIDQLRRRTRNGNDLFFLELVALAVGRKWPDAGREVGELQRRFFDHIPPPPSEPFHWIYTPRDGRVKLWQEIPAGNFLMGSSEDEEGRQGDEGPQHEVRIVSPFQIAVVPVTVAQYRAFDPGYRSEFRGKVPEEALETHPVGSVTWFQACSFCRWLSASLPWARGARLPSEEEWEYACRAGTRSRFWSGDKEPDLERVGWHGDGGDWSTVTTHRVGEKPTNAWGLYDTHGNVWEWTSSLLTDNYSGRESGIVIDPSVGEWPDLAGASGPRQLVARGGSAWATVDWARSACRGRSEPAWDDKSRGFRIVIPVARLEALGAARSATSVP